jgi:predicted transcriptional regulator
MEVGPLEQRVLDLFWKEPEAMLVREAQTALGGKLAYTTVMTTLDRLYKKGFLARRREGRAFRYSARTTREAFAASLLRRSLGRLLPGSSRPLLASLVDAVGEHDHTLLPELQRLVQEKSRAMRKGDE